MKKTLFVLIFVLCGFLIGIATMEVLSRPARRAYREMLQRNFVHSQSRLAYKALNDGNDLKALVHLWTLVEAGQNGTELFRDPVSVALDDTFFVVLPGMNDILRNVAKTRPGMEEAPKGLYHGELAAALEQLGYNDAAKEHYLIASRLLKEPEDRSRKMFQDILKKYKTQELKYPD